MAFVVDSAEWSFDGWTPEEISLSLDRLLERVNTARKRNELVWIGDDLQQRKVLGELNLWEWYLSEERTKLRPEIWQELSTWLNSARHYLDQENWPDCITDTLIQIKDELAQQNVDLAWAHHSTRTGVPTGCISLKRQGLHQTLSSKGEAVLHWIQTEFSHRNFWRTLIAGARDETALESLAAHAYPDLHFHTRVWNGIKKLGGGYLAIRPEINRYLSVLDEHGYWALTFPPPSLDPSDKTIDDKDATPTNQVLERRFRGLNLVMAPEKPNVYADADCRLAREIRIGEKTLYCEWHGKLEPHRNRIHIYKPIPESNNKVIIAIIDEHLPLP